MIRANASRYPISAQCRILGVPRSTYYWMIEHPEAERVDPIAGDVHAIWCDSHERYGARKIKAAHAVERFARDFMALDGDPDRVLPVTCDMGPGFARGIRGRLPNAAKTIDGFHVVKHANEAVDKVRKAEAGENGLLKRTKCLWPGNESNLTDPQPEVRRDPAKRRSKTARACGMRERLQDIHADSANRTEAEAGSKALRSWMMQSRPEPMKALAGQFRRHWQDILAYFDRPYTNAILGGLNGIIRHVKTRSRSFGNMDHSGTMIYLTCGELGLNTVTA